MNNRVWTDWRVHCILDTSTKNALEVVLFTTIEAYARHIGEQSDPDLQQLVEAEARSERNLETVTGFVQSKLDDRRGLDIVACGSLARREWTDHSDFDYLVVVHSLESGVESIRDALKVADRARERLKAPRPGSTGIFGTAVSAPELIARIGLEADTNQTLTRRLLLLEEGSSLYAPAAHNALIQGIFDRYLIEYRTRPKIGVARFLLNDVIRHWRTVAVDYQAKNWNRITDDGWGLRYLKLRISRKLAFASTLAPLMAVATEGLTLSGDLLHRRFSIPSLARLACLHPILHAKGQAALLECTRIAGRFNKNLNSSSFREDSSAVAGPEEVHPEAFSRAVEDSVQLQANLNEVFLGVDSPLKEVSLKYLIF